MNSLVTEFSNSFLQMIRISDFPWKRLTTCIVNEEIDQLYLIEATICHPYVKVYSPSTSYIKLFLKKFINKLEDSGIEVNELVYDKYINLISKELEYEEYYYRIYIIKETLRIIIKETKNLIVEGTTGLTTWQASHVLANYCLENNNRFKSKKILELGSGLGLTGLTLIKDCALKSYTFTDHHPKVLQYLQDNVQINMFENTQKEEGKRQSIDMVDHKYKWQDTDIYIRCLDWEKPTLLEEYDYIIGADIVFDVRVIPCILDLFEKYLKLNCKAILASTIRNEETYNSFLQKFELKGFKMEHNEERSYQESCSQPLNTVNIVIFRNEPQNSLSTK